MKTISKENLVKSERLLTLIQERQRIEKEERALKDYFKDLTTDGVVEVGDILITIEAKTRTVLDRDALMKKLGDKIAEFEKLTQYQQVNVSKRG